MSQLEGKLVAQAVTELVAAARAEQGDLFKFCGSAARLALAGRADSENLCNQQVCPGPTQQALWARSRRATPAPQRGAGLDFAQGPGRLQTRVGARRIADSESWRAAGGRGRTWRIRGGSRPKHTLPARARAPEWLSRAGAGRRKFDGFRREPSR